MSLPVPGLGPAEPRPYQWTTEEYLHLCEAEWFQGRRVQLIGGEIIEMPAQFDLHAGGVSLTLSALAGVFGSGYWVRPQFSLDLSPHGMPDPDVSVIVGNPRGGGEQSPRRRFWSWR